MASVYRQAFRRQKARAVRALTGLPVMPPSLDSMTLDPDDAEIVSAWLSKQDAWFSPDDVTAFEEAFAAWNDSRYATAFMGGRVALTAILHALELAPGDEVLVPGYTCVVVPNAIQFAGLVPVFADIELETYGLDVAKLDLRITSATKAIVIHHLYGLVCRDYEALVQLARQHGLTVIEDCAQATGATYRGRKVGNLGDAAFYSTEQSKLLNTLQGGVATTNNESLAAGIRAYAESAPYPSPERVEHFLYGLLQRCVSGIRPGRWWRSDWALLRYGRHLLESTTADEVAGRRPPHYGQKMPAPLAAVGRNQLRKLDAYNARRREQAQHWHQWCERSGHKPPQVITGSEPVFLRYPVLVNPEKKRDTAWALRELRVAPGVWFTSHTHPTPGVQIDNCPAAEEAIRRCINLPCLT